MGEYTFRQVRSKGKLPEVQNRGDSSTVGILDIAARLGNQAMLSMLERPALEEKQSGSSLEERMREKLERQFGLPMDDVRIHRDSQEPAKFDADAFTYGSNIYLGPGQEELLPHEITHTVQQKMGIVPAQGTENGLPVNNNPILEKEADEGSVYGSQSGSLSTPVVQKGKKKTTPVKYPMRRYRKRIGTSGYPIGTYGFKKREQSRLFDLFHKPVSGYTHQAEHPIGFAVLNNTGWSRNEMGKFERTLPAYQEVYSFHRNHMGTGHGVSEDTEHNSKGAWVSGQRFGFGSDQAYRDDQYTAMADDTSSCGVGTAVQLNQLGYSVPYQHSGFKDTTQIQQSDNSFFQMAQSMVGREIPFYERGTGEEKHRLVTAEEGAEMTLSRLAMRGQSFPGIAVENRVRREFGLPELSLVESDQSAYPSYYESDQKRMMKDLDIMLKKE